MTTREGNYFECAVRYDKTAENGLVKKVTEVYCVKAESFATAEERIIEETAGYASGDYEVKNITPAPYSEIFYDDGGDIYFRAKLQFATIDEVTGREKVTSTVFLVCAKDFPTALATVQKVMDAGGLDYRTAQLSETKILQVYED